MSFRQGRLAGIVAIALAAVAAPAAHAFDAAREARNYSKINERFQHVYGLDPTYKANLAAISTQNEVEYARILATDGPARPFGRNFTGHLCANHGNGCAGDVRYYHWGERGRDGQARAVHGAQRRDALRPRLDQRRGPEARPGIVITNGSVQAHEQLYWFAAQTSPRPATSC